MMPVRSALRFTLVGVACLSSPRGALAQEVALVEKGRTLSVKHCSRCHVIDDENRFSGISSTPSFPLLVNNLDDWEIRFGSFQSRLPHPSVIRFRGDPVDETRGERMVPVELEHSDVDALVAYARSLKRP